MHDCEESNSKLTVDKVGNWAKVEERGSNSRAKCFEIL